ncbi:MAG: hypothetical protein ACRDTR_12055 [Rubrobacter sp.]
MPGRLPHPWEGYLDEARRILRPGDRLVVADMFRAGRPLGADEDATMRGWLAGWAVPDLATPDEFVETARRAGFSAVRVEDATPNVWPSSRRLYRRAQAGYPTAVLLRALGLLGDDRCADVRSAMLQYETLRRGPWSYGIFTASVA